MNIDEIKARLAAATGGPWEFWKSEIECGEVYARGLHNSDKKDIIELRDHFSGYAECGEDLVMELSEGNAALIVNAPTDIAALIEAVEARDKVIEDMDFQSGCSCCEKNNEIRNKHESE